MFENAIQRMSHEEAVAEFNRFAQEYPIMASGMKMIAIMAMLVLGMVLYVTLIKAILRLPVIAAPLDRLRDRLAKTRYWKSIRERRPTLDPQRDGGNIRP